MSQEMDLPCSKTPKKRKKDLLEIVAPTYYIVGEITIIVLFCFSTIFSSSFFKRLCDLSFSRSAFCCSDKNH